MELLRQKPCGALPGRQTLTASAVQFDEMTGTRGAMRAPYQTLARWLETTPPELFQSRRAQAELLFRRIGITFAVYGAAEATERLLPFDILPRVITRMEWQVLEKGLVQRIKALNLLLSDLYGASEIVKAGIIPAALVYRNPAFRPEMAGLRVPNGVYVHIAGMDIVRTAEDGFFVLEDNARTPSGVSYMLENREVMIRLFPELFAMHKVAPVEEYHDRLLATLRSVAPPRCRADPVIVLLTPGRYNSAFYEHSFLADKLGIELVEGCDLFVKDDVVYMRTTEGPQRVDVIYRRLDDEFLDPLAFRPDSILGVPGLFSAYQTGNVTLANAVGTGVADDKAMYTYIPDAIRFYLGEEPLLRNVPTWRCRDREDRDYVLKHLPELVVKEVNGSGGYGMLVGPHAAKAEIAEFAAKIAADPENFIAQPTLALSTCPVWLAEGIAPRHVDLRPFVLQGANGTYVTPGGLTRVAMAENCLVVNSSQGGGTKDTWVIDDVPAGEA